MQKLMDFFPGKAITAAALVLVLAGPLSGGVAEAEDVADLTLLGARARAMGGAYTAVANGIDAVGWNPAGLAGIEHATLAADTRLSFGSGAVKRGIEVFPAGTFGDTRVLDFRDSPGTRFTYYFVEGAVPIPVEGQLKSAALVAAAGYRRVIDLLFRQEQLLEIDAGGGNLVPIEHIDESEGGVDALSVSVAGALPLTDRLPKRLALGINLNFLTGFVDDTDLVRVALEGREIFTTEESTHHKVDGFSADLGARLEVMPELTVGAIFRPGYDIEFKDGRGRFRQLVLEGGPIPPGSVLLEERIASLTREVPTFYGVGAAGTPVAGLVVAADFQYRPWNESVLTVHNPSGQNTVVEEGRYEAHSFHVGGEYTFYRGGSVEVPLRFGFRTRPTSLANADSLSTAIGRDGFRTFRGDRVEGNTWSGGIGLHFATVDFDVAMDRTALTIAEFSEYFTAPPFPGEALRIVEIEEVFTNVYFGSTLRF